MHSSKPTDRSKPKPSPTLQSPLSPPIALIPWPRRLFHIATASSIPIAFLYLSDALVLWGLIALSVLAVLGEVARLVWSQANDLMLRLLPLFKPSERHLITGATYMLLAATLVILVFDKPVAILALLFLAVGDPMAALVGGRVRKGRVFGKSLAGTTAFVVFAGAAGVLATLHPGVPLAWWFVPGLLVAAVVELLPVPVDDNVTVPVAGASVMHLLAMM